MRVGVTCTHFFAYTMPSLTNATLQGPEVLWVGPDDDLPAKYNLQKNEFVDLTGRVVIPGVCPAATVSL